MPRRRVTPAAEEVQHDPLDHDDQGNDEQINRTESADSSPAESRDRNQSVSYQCTSPADACIDATDEVTAI